MPEEVGSVIYRIRGDNSGFAGDVSKSQSIATGAAGAIQKVFAAISFTAVLAGLGQVAVAAFNAGNSFESAFAGVVKTVDATAEELSQLRAGIIGLSEEIPVGANELSAIAEAAGQLGIAKDKILAFTEVMANMGVATNMSSDAAATGLARIANITSMSQDNFERLGSTVVDLGNKLATTESEIVNMSLRIAGAGHQAGMTEAQITSVAAALSSLGMEAEAGGSAVSKVIINMKVAAETGAQANAVIDQTGYSLRDLQLMADADGESFKALAQSMGMTSTELKAVMDKSQSLKDFSDVLGMTADEFSKFFAEDAVGALNAFIEGLGKAESKGLSAVQVLDNMGISEIRMRDALLRAASSAGMLTQALDIGTKAWEENTALATEASKRYETMESKIDLLKNTANNLGISFYDKVRPGIEAGVTAATKFVSSLQKIVTGMKDMTVEEAAERLDRFATTVEVAVAAIITFAAVMKIAPLISSVSAAIGTASLQLALYTATNGVAAISAAALNGTLTVTEILVGALTGKLTLATAAQALLNAVTAANPYVLLALALAAVVAGIVLFVNAVNDGDESLEKLKADIESTKAGLDELEASMAESKDAYDKAITGINTHSDAADKLIPRLEELANKTKRTAAENDELAIIVAKLNNLVPDLNLQYDRQTGKLNKATDAVKDYVEAQKKEALFNEKLARWTQLQDELTTAKEKYAEAIANEAVAAREAAEAQEEYAAALVTGSEYIAMTALASTGAATKAWEDARTELGRAATDFVNLQTESRNLDGELEDLTPTTDDAAESLEGAAEAAKALEKAAGKAGASTPMLQRFMEELGLSAEEAAQKIDEYASAITDGLERISLGTEISAREIGDNLAFSRQAWADWWKNLDILAERGISEGFIRKMETEGVEKWGAAVAAMIDAPQEDLDYMDEQYLAAVEATLGAMAAKISDFENMGEMFAAGIASGIIAGKQAVVEAITGVAESVTGKFKQKMEIASPSKKMKREGKQLPAGLAEGVKENADAPVEAINDIGERILRGNFGIEGAVSHMITASPAASHNIKLSIQGDVLMDGHAVGRLIFEHADDVLVNM